MSLLVLGIGIAIIFFVLLFFLSLNTAFYFVVFAVFAGLILTKTLVYFYNIDIIAHLTSPTSAQVTVNENSLGNSLGESQENSNVLPNSSPSVPEIKIKPQVFNIPGNNYDYLNANALCLAYGARLANYSEIEDAYNRGGEWCNYGWSEGQMALFPTQMSSYKKLQKTKGHEHDCGRPGINGGYIANPNVKFGVNCYGYKPEITTLEEKMMSTVSPFPMSMEDILLEKRVEYWKGQLNDILISPFNHEYWSKILRV